MIFYHNPRCSKSRQTKEILEKKKYKFQTKLYLEEGITATEIKDLSKALGLNIIEFCRTKESIFKELDLKNANETQLIKAMTKNPILLERPILLHKKKAAIGRPPEKVLEIL